jgi:hypothetical protein
MKFNGWTKRRQGMNGLWTNKLDEIERNPKVIPCFFSPRIFMKFQIQWMNKKEARYERTMNQQLDEIIWNGWPFTCGLIRAQTYMQMTTCLCNSQPTVYIFRLGNWSCGVISWYLRLLLWKKNICGVLHHMITHPHSEPKQIIFFFFSWDVAYPWRCFNFTWTNFKAVSE